MQGGGGVRCNCACESVRGQQRERHRNGVRAMRCDAMRAGGLTKAVASPASARWRQPHGSSAQSATCNAAYSPEQYSSTGELKI